jgi:isopenicillin-N N-acyltransferase-like protein
VPSCKRKQEHAPLPVEPAELEPDTLTETETVSAFFAGTDSSFPMLEVGGKPYDIGRVIGRTFAEDIRKGFEKRMAWWKELKAFANAQPKNVYDTFEAAARKYTPTVYEELRGWADGSGFPLRDLMILNLKAEYGAMLDEARKKEAKPPPGCSTIVLKDGKRIIIAHNEDGDAGYLEHMFMLKVRPESGVSFLCASYPGILPGNAPWVNDRGVVMTTNFIYTKEVKLGVGRYFLDRLSMEAKTLEDALKICRHPERAYAFHHVIGSVPDSRVVSLEVTPSLEALTEIDGIFIHTNHLIAPSLVKEAQDEEYVSTSSRTRWDVLSKWKEELPKDVSEVTEEQIIGALMSHEGKPYSPCRHPEGDIGGATLLTALFNLEEKTMRVYKLQPCNNKINDYDFPGE